MGSTWGGHGQFERRQNGFQMENYRSRDKDACTELGVAGKRLE